MRVEIGAVLYALVCGLLLYPTWRTFRRIPERLSYVPWRRSPSFAATRHLTTRPEKVASASAPVLLVESVDLLRQHHQNQIVAFAVLFAPIVIGMYIMQALHNREVARAEVLPTEFAVHH